LEDITAHYVLTLRRWRENLHRHVDEVRRLGYPDHFIRMWDYYFAYCEAGFYERHNGDVQMLFSKSPLPSTIETPVYSVRTALGCTEW
jgi:cyclopropane-fatty-acyl-phospholipid synthase